MDWWIRDGVSKLLSSELFYPLMMSRAAVILFLVLFIRFLVQLSGNNESSAIKGQEFMDILIVAVTVIVVAIPGKVSSELKYQAGG